MAKASLSERLKTSALVRPSEVMHNIVAVRDMAVFRDEDGLVGKVHKTRALSDRARSGALGGQLSKLLSGRRPGGRFRAKGANAAFAQDGRQRVVVTVFYQGHGGSGAGKLIAHGKYLERDGAGPEGEPGQFYDHEQDRVEAGPRLAKWADEDKRHMRLMLAPESGARIEDLKDFTRATMAQMERDLGMPLEWVTVEEAAQVLCVSVKTLEAWRRLGKGPVFVKLGRSVRYTMRALDQFTLERTVRNSAEGRMLDARR